MPAWIAFSVVRLLEQHFPRLVDYGFTAELEDVLDEVAGGREERVAVLQSFWTGEGENDTGLKRLIENLPDIDARSLATFEIGEGINLRVGRYGPYVEGPPMLPGDGGTDVPTRANVPEDLPPDELTLELAEGAARQPGRARRRPSARIPRPAWSWSRRTVASARTSPKRCPGRRRRAPKARTASLFESMSLDSIGIDDAVKLLTLPRVVGTDVDGQEITAQNGRYGPYLKKGSDSRSLQTEDQLLSLTEDEARAIYAQPKTYGRGRAAAAPLKELGDDPVSGKPIVAKDGRFGMYVTDGEYNATLRKDDSTRHAHARARPGAAGRAPREGPGQEGRQARSEEDQRRRSAAKKAAAKKTAAKKAAE